MEIQPLHMSEEDFKDTLEILKYDLKYFDFESNEPRSTTEVMQDKINMFVENKDLDSLTDYIRAMKHCFDEKYKEVQGNGRFTWYIRAFQAVASTRDKALVNDWLDRGFSKDSKTAMKVACSFSLYDEVFKISAEDKVLAFETVVDSLRDKRRKHNAKNITKEKPLADNSVLIECLGLIDDQETGSNRKIANTIIEKLFIYNLISPSLFEKIIIHQNKVSQRDGVDELSSDLSKIIPLIAYLEIANLDSTVGYVDVLKRCLDERQFKELSDFKNYKDEFKSRFNHVFYTSEGGEKMMELCASKFTDSASTWSDWFVAHFSEKGAQLSKSLFNQTPSIKMVKKILSLRDEQADELQDFFSWLEKVTLEEKFTKEIAPVERKKKVL